MKKKVSRERREGAKKNLGGLAALPEAFASTPKERAVELLLRAIRIRADYIEAYHNLGCVLREMGRFGEAVVWLRQAVRLGVGEGKNLNAESAEGAEKKERKKWHPLTASCLNQLGLALVGERKYEEAEECYRRALDIDLKYAEAQGNLGNLYQEMGRLPEALAYYELALIHDPESPATHWNRALALLQVGDYERGWAEYEWRWRRPMTPPRPFKQPRWDGSPLGGRTLLVYMEQGLGDVLQFIRYVPLIKRWRTEIPWSHAMRPDGEVAASSAEGGANGTQSVRTWVPTRRMGTRNVVLLVACWLSVRGLCCRCCKAARGSTISSSRDRRCRGKKRGHSSLLIGVEQADIGLGFSRSAERPKGGLKAEASCCAFYPLRGTEGPATVDAGS